MSGVPNLKYKTSICNVWQEGLFCQKGHLCFFAHGQNELRTMQQNREILVQQSSQLMQQITSKYKTTFCKFYAKGDCKLGQNCSFAHNKSQKRKKAYVQKQQIMIDPNMYYYPQYYYPYMNQYIIQTPVQTQFYPDFTQVQAQGMVEQLQKFQQIQNTEDIKQQHITKSQPELSNIDCQSQ